MHAPNRPVLCGIVFLPVEAEEQRKPWHPVGLSHRLIDFFLQDPALKWFAIILIKSFCVICGSPMDVAGVKVDDVSCMVSCVHARTTDDVCSITVVSAPLNALLPS